MADGFDMQRWLDCVSLADSLTPRELRVLLRMSRYADYRTGNSIRPSAARVATETGIARRHLMGAGGAISALVEKGWLVRVREATKSAPAHYRLSTGTFRTGFEVNETVTSNEVTVLVTSPESEVTETVTSEVTDLVTSEVTKTVTSEVTKTVTQSTQEQPKNNPENNSLPHAPAAEDEDVIDAEVIDEAEKAAEDAIEIATRLAKHLEARIRANGSTATYTPHWRKAIVSILARPTVRPSTVEYVIDFAATDEWWSGRIYDAASFAKHYDQLAVKAQTEWRRQQAKRPAWQRSNDEQMAGWIAEHGVPPTSDPKELTS